MSLGALGSSSQNFRDFLGGGQRDISRGLQAVLGAYDPSGNSGRLIDRGRGMYSLNTSEYDAAYNFDSQNSWAESWYSEYRAVLQLRAEALKKKMNRAYTKVLENSMYAPMRPDEKWAPQANLDRNDIKADDPLQLPGPTDEVIPPIEKAEPNLNYNHPEWFEPDGDEKTSDNAYDDIRRYMNLKFPFADLDADGDKISFDGGADGDPNDGSYSVSSESGYNDKYLDLWDAGLGQGNHIYDLNNVNSLGGAAGSWWKEIAEQMNVPPSTSTQNFQWTATGGDRYYIEIPAGKDFRDVASLLPSTLSGTGQFGSWKAGTEPTGGSLQWKTFWSGASGFIEDDLVPGPPPSGGPWVEYKLIDAGTKLYDTRTIANDGGLFTNNSGYGAPANNYTTGITLNPQLAAPPGANQAEQDMVVTTSMPVYQQDFVDSWLEARALQKREAQIEAAYKAYKDGSDAIGADMTYRQKMDQVFTALDQLAGLTDGINGGGSTPVGPGPIPSGPGGPSFPPPPPAGGPVSFPPDVGNPSGGVDMSNTIPYGFHLIPNAPAPGYSVSGTLNDVYGHGRDYAGTNSAEAGSIYYMIYKRLSYAATDPSAPVDVPSGATGTPGTVNSGSDKFGDVTYPPTGSGGNHGYADVPGDSGLYTPIPVGAAENTDNGQPNINIGDAGTDELSDTMKQVPDHAYDYETLSNLFVGRQWDKVPGVGDDYTREAGVGAVKYERETISSHMMMLPGWYGGSSDGLVGSALLTLNPPIEGLALQTGASFANWGRIDDFTNTWMGGAFLRVGGGADSSGFPDLDGSPTKYNIGVGIGVGTLGFFWGHTSALGRLRDITIGNDEPGDTSAEGADMTTRVGPLFTALKFTLEAMAAISKIGGGEGDISIFPNVGIAGFNFDANLPIPIPIPPPGPGITFLNIPMTTYGGISFDLMTWYFYEFLESLKHKILDSVSVFSYATSGGFAMDSYGMRAEYHFTETGAFETLNGIPSLGPIDFGDIAETVIDLLGNINDGDQINQASLKERLLLKRHSNQAGEARELDTGAFFSTAAFLSQFHVDELEYSYWTASQQNEEVANMDTARMLLTSGKEIIQAMGKALFIASGNVNPASFTGAAIIMTMNMLQKTFFEGVSDAVMWDIFFHDQNQSGFVTSSQIKSSRFQSEGYDFIEDERKLFESDYQSTNKKGVIQQLAGAALGEFQSPNVVLEGLANTRRYKTDMTGIDATAGRERNIGAENREEANRNVALDGSDPNQTILGVHDSSWSIHDGFWNDTGLGDINEVYVRKNTVSWTNINDGFGDGGLTPTVSTQIDRYVGSHNRIFGRSYDGGSALNLQSFRTGYFRDKYFGEYITLATGNNIQNTRAQNITLYEGTDQERDAALILHGGKGYYDRRKDYSMKFTLNNSPGSEIILNAQQALNPTLGGGLKLASIDKNDPNAVLGRDVSGQENPLTALLQEHMRVKDDGSNMQLVREYRDVFSLGLLDDTFISISVNSPLGGGISSSIRINFNSDTNATSAVNLGAFETEAADNYTVGNGGYLGNRAVFKNASRAKIDIFLNSYVAFRRKAEVPSQ
jgi:hypothetical protein